MEALIPTLIGYMAKRRVWRGGPGGTIWPVAPSTIEEICSVSRCIAAAPEAWRDGIGQNPFSVYDSPDLAWAQVPTDLRKEFDVFAYRLYPVYFADGREESVEALGQFELDVERLPENFVQLGWDAVQGGKDLGFGCSPLSCNGQAGQDGLPEVNRHCLVSSEALGLELARRFSVTKPEPGPYCVVEVWRATPEDRRDQPSQ